MVEQSPRPRRAVVRASRPGAPAAGVPYDVSGHLSGSGRCSTGIVVHGSREELAARLAASAAATAGSRGPATRGATGGAEPAEGDRRPGRPPARGRALRPTSWPGSCSGCSMPRGATRRGARHVPRRRDTHTSGSGPTRSSAAPDDLVAAPAAVLGLAAWLAGHGALAWCAVDRCLDVDPATRWPGWSPRCSPTRCPVRVVAGGVVSAHADPEAMGTPSHGHPDRRCRGAAGRRPDDAVRDVARPEVLREYAHHQGAARRTTDRLDRGCRGRRRRPHCGRVASPRAS